MLGLPKLYRESRRDNMKVKVICSICNEEFDWLWGKESYKCPGCNEKRTIKEVRMKEGEVLRLFE